MMVSKKNIAFLTSLLFAFFANSQNSKSILKNYGFEKFQSPYFLQCETNNNPNPIQRSDYNDYYESIKNWTAPEPKYGIFQQASTSDVICPCCDPTADTYEPLNGDAFAWTLGSNNEWTEWFAGNLAKSGLKDNNKYLVTFRTIVPKNTGKKNITNAGIRFFADKDAKMRGTKKDFRLSNIINKPHVKVGRVKNKKKWDWQSAYFNALFDYDKVVIGPFGSKENIGWDDIRVTEVCKPVRKFENIDFYDEQTLYKASKKIVAGRDVDSKIVNGDVEISSNSRVIFKAPKVVLKPGFSKQSDGSFTKIIADECDEDYIGCPILPEIPSRRSSCNGEELDIGVTEQLGVSYNWSPSTYLDDPNSSNPTFDPPSGEGQMLYEVTMTNLCGRSKTQEVLVHYDDTPNPNPSLNLNSISKEDYKLSFSAQVGPNTKFIKVEIPDANFSKKYYSDSDFSCCSFNFDRFFNTCGASKSSYKFSSCENLQVSVTAKNYCNPNKTTSTFNWNPSSGLSSTTPNIITPNNDGVNDELGFDVSGADNYVIAVYNRWGDVVHTKNSCVLNDPVLAWDPSCCTEYSEGTYYYTLKLVNDCGEEKTFTNNLTIISGNCGCKSANSDTTTNGKKLKQENEENGSDSTYGSNSLTCDIFPNPSNSFLNVHLSELSQNSSLSLINSKGKMVLKKNVNDNTIKISTSQFSSGLYLLKVNNFKEFSKKVIIK